MKLKNVETGFTWEFSLPEDQEIAQRNVENPKFKLIEISKKEKEFITIPEIPAHLSIEDRLLHKKEENIKFDPRDKNVDLEKLLNESQ